MRQGEDRGGRVGGRVIIKVRGFQEGDRVMIEIGGSGRVGGRGHGEDRGGRVGERRQGEDRGGRVRGRRQGDDRGWRQWEGRMEKRSLSCFSTVLTSYRKIREKRI